jgi:hypothetical protein
VFFLPVKTLLFDDFESFLAAISGNGGRAGCGYRIFVLRWKN